MRFIYSEHVQSYSLDKLIDFLVPPTSVRGRPSIPRIRVAKADRRSKAQGRQEPIAGGLEPSDRSDNPMWLAGAWWVSGGRRLERRIGPPRASALGDQRSHAKGSAKTPANIYGI